MKKLVCFGDSLTEEEFFTNGTPRLTPRIREAFPDWEVINSGVSGNSTRNALSRIDTDVIKQNPDYVTVLFGANDMYLYMIEIDEYKSNLEKIVDKIGFEKTILITPSPFNEYWTMFGINNKVELYAEAARQVSAEKKCNLIDLFVEMKNCTNYLEMLSDGVHFTPYGYAFFSSLVIRKLSEL